MAQKPALIAIIAVLVLVLAGAIAMLIINSHRLSTTPTTTPTTTLPQPSLKQPTTYIALKPSLTTKGELTYLNFALDPQTPNQPISAIALKIDVHNKSGKVTAASNSPVFDDAFKGNGWNYPFSEIVQNNDGSITLKLSAIYATPEPYVLAPNTAFVSIPLSGSQTNVTEYSYTVDSQVSEAYDKAQNLIGFTDAGTVIDLSR